MTKMIFIPPFQLLKTTTSNYRHLMLPHLRHNKEYSDHYHKLSRTSQYIILDNGANEGVELSFGELAQVAYTYKVDELVLPDAMGDPELTNYRALDFLADYRNLVPIKTKLNYVLHGYSATHTIETYEKLKKNKTLFERISVLSIPRMLVKPNGLNNRIKVAQHILQDERLPKQIHFLGASPLFLEEGTLVRDVLKGRVRSMDTSAPYVYALRDRSVSEPIAIQRDHNAYFTIPLGVSQIDLARQNCEIMNGWIGAQASASSV